MTYQETLEYLYTRLPMYQRDGKVAYNQDLSNTIKLLGTLDNPHKKFKSVHIAGTNGKGTSAHGIAAILQTAGYKTGLYTSPHLKNFTERIRINGEEVSEAFVIDFVEKIKPAIEEIEPSFFEITVAMAFAYFASQEVDIVVVETGLGGRLDSTNVIDPEVSLITNIGYDHTDLLGDTLEKIAHEKAGIIKPNVPVVIGEMLAETEPVFVEVAEKNQSPLIRASQPKWKAQTVVPNYLVRNVAGIESVMDELKSLGWSVSAKDIDYGMSNMQKLTGLKGRFQILKETPLEIADVSHNKEGLKMLFDQVEQLRQGTIHLIFGSVKDKDIGPILDLIPAKAKCYWTQSHVPRSLSVEELAIQAVVRGREGECFKDVNEAIRTAREKVLPEDLILITGSTFVVAEIDDL